MDSNEKRYRSALEFAAKKHKGQFRIGGLPYITHPVAVAEIVKESGYDTEYQIAALFHDLLEDTDAKEDEILSIGGEEVLEAVKLLTKKKGYVMGEYVSDIRKNKMAFVIKGADRLHNLRSAVVSSEDFKRKYVLETLDWYMDFSPEIPTAVRALAESMENPIAELSLIYEPVDNWKIDKKNIE